MANSVIQPIVVRPTPKVAADAPGCEIVAGERRWQAAKLAGLTEIPVVIRELSDQEAVAVALIENIQREELTPAEEARSLKRLIEEFTLTHQEVATAVGRSRALLGLDDDAERVRLSRLVAKRGLSVRETENLVRRVLKGEGSEGPKKPPELSVVSEVLRTSAVHPAAAEGEREGEDCDRGAGCEGEGCDSLGVRPRG